MATKKTTQSTSAKKTTPKSTLKEETNKLRELDGLKSRGRKKKILIPLFIGVVLAGLWFYKGSFVAAVVNGTPITRMAVIKEIENQIGGQTLDSLISESLILQEAQNKGVDVTSEDVDAEIDEIKEQLEEQGQTLEQILEFQGIGMEQVIEQTKIQLILEKLLAERIEISDEEINDGYEAQLESLEEGHDEDEVKNAIRESLYGLKLQEEVPTLLEELKENANIQYFHQY